MLHFLHRCPGAAPAVHASVKSAQKDNVSLLLYILFPGLESRLHLAKRPGRDVNCQHADKDDSGLSQSAHKRRIIRDDELSVPELIHKVSRLDGHGRSANGVKVGSGEVDRGRGNGRLGNVGVELDIPASLLDMSRPSAILVRLTRRPRGGGP